MLNTKLPGKVHASRRVIKLRRSCNATAKDFNYDPFRARVKSLVRKSKLRLIEIHIVHEPPPPPSPSMIFYSSPSLRFPRVSPSPRKPFFPPSKTVFLLNGVHPYLHTRSTEKLSTIFATINHTIRIYIYTRTELELEQIFFYSKIFG